MAEDRKASTTSTPLLNQDVFQSDRSQELFRAIDEIQQAGSRLDLGLPEVRDNHTTDSVTLMLTLYPARDNRRSICRQIIAAAKLDRHPVPRRRRPLYQISDTHHL